MLFQLNILEIAALFYAQFHLSCHLLSFVLNDWCIDHHITHCVYFLLLAHYGLSIISCITRLAKRIQDIRIECSKLVYPPVLPPIDSLNPWLALRIEVGSSGLLMTYLGAIDLASFTTGDEYWQADHPIASTLVPAALILVLAYQALLHIGSGFIMADRDFFSEFGNLARRICNDCPDWLARPHFHAYRHVILPLATAAVHSICAFVPSIPSRSIAAFDDISPISSQWMLARAWRLASCIRAIKHLPRATCQGMRKAVIWITRAIYTLIKANVVDPCGAISTMTLDYFRSLVAGTSQDLHTVPESEDDTHQSETGFRQIAIDIATLSTRMVENIACLAYQAHTALVIGTLTLIRVALTVATSPLCMAFSILHNLIAPIIDPPLKRYFAWRRFIIARRGYLDARASISAAIDLEMERVEREGYFILPFDKGFLNASNKWVHEPELHKRRSFNMLPQHRVEIKVEQFRERYRLRSEDFFYSQGWLLFLKYWKLEVEYRTQWDTAYVSYEGERRWANGW